jgi:hypothetical protein
MPKAATQARTTGSKAAARRGDQQSAPWSPGFSRQTVAEQILVGERGSQADARFHDADPTPRRAALTSTTFAQAAAR